MGQAGHGNSGTSHNGAMTGDAHLFDERSLASFDDDLFANNLRLFPIAPVFILAGILWVKFLDVEIFHIGDGIGDTPGDMLVVSYDYPRCAWEADSNHIDFARHQVILVPDGWCGLAQVWIVAEDRRAGGSHGAIDDPVVAGTHHAKATELFELFVLLQHAEVDTLVFKTGGNNQGMFGIIARFQFGGPFRAEHGHDTRADDLRLPVTTEVPAHHLGPLNAVRDAPRL